MKFDIHVHCNSHDENEIAALVKSCEKNETIACLSGGLRYGAHDYEPNDFVLELSRRYPHCFRAFAKVDLWDKEADGDAIRRFKEQGFSGLKCIYPYYAYDHDMYMNVYEAAEECGLPVLFHTGNYRPCKDDLVYKRPMLTNMCPLKLDRIARSFQKLNIIMAHLGTSFWRLEAAEMLKMHDNVYADLAGCGAWMSQSAERLAELLRPEIPVLDTELKGWRKLVLGSDAYVTHPHIIGDAAFFYTSITRQAGLPKDVVDGIMGGTAASVFGIQ